MFCTGNRQTRGGSRTPYHLWCSPLKCPAITLLTKQLKLRWCRSRRPASLSFHGNKRGQKRRGLKHFTHWYLLSFLGVSNIIYCCYETCCCLIDPLYNGFSTKFYLNQSPFLGNTLINCQDIQSPRKFFISKQKIFSASSYD